MSFKPLLRRFWCLLNYRTSINRDFLWKTSIFDGIFQNKLHSRIHLPYLYAHAKFHVPHVNVHWLLTLQSSALQLAQKSFTKRLAFGSISQHWFRPSLRLPPAACRKLIENPTFRGTFFQKCHCSWISSTGQKELKKKLLQPPGPDCTSDLH